MTWLKANWKQLIPFISAILGLTIGAKLFVKDGTIVIVPPEEVQAIESSGARGTNPAFILAARIHASRQHAQEERIPFARAWQKVRKLSAEDIVTAAAQAGVSAEAFAGFSLEGILKWFADHQEEIMAFVKVILALLAAFAQGHPAVELFLPFGMAVG